MGSCKSVDAVKSDTDKAPLLSGTDAEGDDANENVSWIDPRGPATITFHMAPDGVRMQYTVGEDSKGPKPGPRHPFSIIRFFVDVDGKACLALTGCIDQETNEELLPEDPGYEMNIQFPSEDPERVQLAHKLALYCLKCPSIECDMGLYLAPDMEPTWSAIPEAWPMQNYQNPDNGKACVTNVCAKCTPNQSICVKCGDGEASHAVMACIECKTVKIGACVKCETKSIHHRANLCDKCHTSEGSVCGFCKNDV